MKSMVNEVDKVCPFKFNTDADSFKPGDIICYYAPSLFGDIPFVGKLVEVHRDFVVLKHKDSSDLSDQRISATREGYPKVSREEAERVLAK